MDRRLTLENAKARLLDTLAHRPLTNAEVREITQLGRHQCFRLMQSLRAEGKIKLKGVRRAAQWHLRGGTNL